MAKNWYKYATGYQIYPRSFMDSNGDGIGDLQGIIAKLSYLKDLGIDFVWLNPIYASPNVDNGYDISDYQAVNPEYGTMEDLRTLVDKAHALGMKVLFDLVVNHTSDEHSWFKASRSSKDNPYRDFYHWVEGKPDCPPNNWISFHGDSAWTYDEATSSYYLHIFDKKQPDLNWKNPRVRQAIYEMIAYWLDFGIDGFRLDAISHLQKKSYDFAVRDWQGDGPWEPFMNVEGIKTYMEDLKAIFNRYGALTVGEASGVRSWEAPSWTGADGYMTMIFEWEQNARSADGSGDLAGFISVLNRWQKDMTPDGWCGLYLENHDIPRIVSSFGDGSLTSSKAFAVAYFLLRGTPFIYQGQELAMTNLPLVSSDQLDQLSSGDSEAYQDLLAKEVSPQVAFDQVTRWSRDHARSPMQWSAAQNAGFSTGQAWSTLNPNYQKRNVQAVMEDPQSPYQLYRALIALRHDNAVVAEGTYLPVDEGNPAVFAYRRVWKDKQLLIMVNLSPQTAELSLERELLEQGWQELDLGNPQLDRPLSPQMRLVAYEYHVFGGKF